MKNQCFFKLYSILALIIFMSVTTFAAALTPLANTSFLEVTHHPAPYLAHQANLPQ